MCVCLCLPILPPGGYFIVQRGTCTACAVHCGLCVNTIRNPGGEGNDSDIFFMFTALDFSLCQRVICFIEWFVVFFYLCHVPDHYLQVQKSLFSH